MKIGRPEIVLENGEAVYRVSVDSQKGKEVLWYRLNDSFADLVSPSCDAALAALLLPAMANGEDVIVEGPISEKLLFNLTRYQVLLQRIMPDLCQVRIAAEEVSSFPITSRGVATGFSGGIDSFCVLADYHYQCALDGFKITHLLFNNVGSHGRGGEQLSRKRYERLLPVAQSLGLPFIMINSNLSSFYDKGLGFINTATARNASVALLLQKGIRRYLYASSNHYRDLYTGPALDAYDTVILPLLSTECIESFSVGSEYTRVEKTIKVAELPDSYRALDVCVNSRNVGPYVNCSECWKCLRVLATLEIAGLLERYSAVFDLDKYRRKRLVYFAKLLTGNSDMLREIISYGNEKKFAWPVAARILRPFFWRTKH